MALFNLEALGLLCVLVMFLAVAIQWLDKSFTWRGLCALAKLWRQGTATEASPQRLHGRAAHTSFIFRCDAQEQSQSGNGGCARSQNFKDAALCTKAAAVLSSQRTR